MAPKRKRKQKKKKDNENSDVLERGLHGNTSSMGHEGEEDSHNGRQLTAQGHRLHG
jgi:hypothetical protein